MNAVGWSTIVVSIWGGIIGYHVIGTKKRWFLGIVLFLLAFIPHVWLAVTTYLSTDM